MNVIIIAAGKSKRFRDEKIRIPKFLLKINNQFLIENIFENYDEKCKFKLIVNKKDYHSHTRDLQSLKKKYANLSIYEIPNHNLGPVKSLSYVQDIIEDKTIITYCDFLIEWDFENFKRYCFDKEVVVPFFRGFHPASLGKHTYDYLRNYNNNKDRINKIKVKESFTKNKMKESGVVGIYYFKDSHILKNFLSNIKFMKNEIYLTHIIQLYLKKKISVHSYQVQKFLCLGTPFDYFQYKNFEAYFNRKKLKKIMLDQILLPMAGSGSRMKKDLFRTIKPFITIENKPMYFTALNDHPNSKSNYLITNKKQFNKYNFNKLLKNINYKTIYLNGPTESQIHTCLKAINQINHQQNVLISSCDYGLSFDPKKLDMKLKKKYDVLIWVFKLKNLVYANKNAFAYCKTKGQKVIQISEKKTISTNHDNDYFLVGTFLFRKAEDFFHCIQSSIDKNEKINNEYYIGNSINSMIKQGKKVFIYEIDSWASFGTPLELQIYYYWSDYFHNLKNAINK